MKLSVIIPTLNERYHLPAAVESIRTAGPVHEIIVVDASSDDGTCEWARAQEDVILITAPRSRGGQLRAGAARASGDVFWFLHADCTVPPNSVRDIERAMRKPVSVAGAFPIHFDTHRPTGIDWVASLHNMRSRMFHEITGAQGLFTRRVTYEVVGGFPDQPLFEDHNLVVKLKRLGKIAIMADTITVSSRRYVVCGMLGTIAKTAWLEILMNAGVPAKRLKTYYPDIREAAPADRQPTPAG